MTLVNVTCWLLQVDKRAIFSFDQQDNDRDKLLKLTSDLDRKRIGKSSFDVEITKQDKLALADMYGKKLNIKIRIVKYHFYDGNDQKKTIEGYKFVLVL